MRTCLECSSVLVKHSQKKYCSNKCQADKQYSNFLSLWKINEYSTKNISKHIKRYLIEKFGEQCSVCKWNMRHLKTKRVPLEIDHIDGNADNNREENLRLLCPNCHSLTANYKNFNRGKGRIWRRLNKKARLLPGFEMNLNNVQKG